MNAVHDDVIKLVGKEFAYANTKFPLFTSTHEGYAVLKEEFEETFDELVNMRGQLGLIWDGTKKNKMDTILTGVVGMYDTAIAIAIEAIQVAAMCRKYEVSIGAPAEKGEL